MNKMERKLTEQEIVRREKLKSVERPYPDKYATTHTISEARNLEDGTTNVAIAGRIGFMRKMGKLSFVKIRNIEDAIQLKIEADKLGAEKYDEFKKIFDAGDFIGAKGTIITTQTGEKSLEVEELTFLGKALRPLPEKFHGLVDKDPSEIESRNLRQLLRKIREYRDYLNNKEGYEIQLLSIGDGIAVAHKKDE
jgi:lysyl-tRNA synthetase class 2